MSSNLQNPNTIPTTRLLTDLEAAPIINQKPSTLRKWRMQGKGPAYRKHGRSVRYALADLMEYSDRQRVAR